LGGNGIPKFILSLRYDPDTHTEYKMQDIYEETRGILIDYGIEIPEKLDKPEIWLEFEDTFLQRRALKHVYMHILNKYVRIYGNRHDRKEGINAFIFDEELVEKWADLVKDDKWRKNAMDVAYRSMFRMTKAKDMVPAHLTWKRYDELEWNGMAKMQKYSIKGLCYIFPFYVQKRRKEE
jgi:hypothetical protein